MSSKHRSYLGTINRMVIFSLSVAGLLMDSFQPADVPFTVALIVWLWLPLCTRFEARAIDFISMK